MRRICLVWSSGIWLLTPRLIDTEIAAQGGGSTPSITAIVGGIVNIPKLSCRTFLFLRFMLVVSAYRQQPCEGFSGFLLS